MPGRHANITCCSYRRAEQEWQKLARRYAALTTGTG